MGEEREANKVEKIYELSYLTKVPAIAVILFTCGKEHVGERQENVRRRTRIRLTRRSTNVMA